MRFYIHLSITFAEFDSKLVLPFGLGFIDICLIVPMHILHSTYFILVLVWSLF